MSVAFLLEIGVEEIPDWMIVPALKNLEELFSALSEQNGLRGSVQSVDATPRRLVLRAGGFLERQENRSELVTGPAKSAPEKAVEGFAKKQGVSLADLELSVTERGQYWQYLKKVAGRETLAVLAEHLPGMIGKIYFPKTMYWTGKGGARFIRPVRWIVALLGEQVVPFEFAGVSSSFHSSGHRRLGLRSFPVTIANYEEELRKNFVILAASARRQAIREGLAADVRADEELLETLVYLTEFPTAIRGSFDPQFLSLPQEILTTVMRHHQRYFSVQDEKGGLAPHFAAVMNTSSDPEGLVRTGNERVLRARFNDARFFWDVDQRKPLTDRVADLANVTFQAKLGSYLEKTQRMMELAGEIAEQAGASQPESRRAAELCKCDLTTEMVKEFTELQGLVGGLYAKEQGHAHDVWRAIYDHYKPVSMEDSIPSGLVGQVVSLADKIDTLRGCFGIGMVPTGSKDPFALRRAAQGVVKIIVEGKLRLSLQQLVKGDRGLLDFLIDRVRHYFREVRGYHYDEVNAVISSGCDDLNDAAMRLDALAEVRPTENFEPLAASFKRIQNILRQAGFEGHQAIDPAMLEAGPEAELHTSFMHTREKVLSCRAKSNYRDALAAIATLRPKVDHFFDKVLVNVPDERLRRNRLGLLHQLLTEFSALAEFSEIVTTH